MTTKKKKGLKIAVLASNWKLYSNKRLMEAGEERGHEMHFVAIHNCYMDITAKKPEIHYRGGEILGRFDAVIPRVRPAITFYGIAVLRQLEMQGTYCLNGPIAIGRARDKLRTLQMLSSEKIDIPRTGFAHSPQDTKDLITMVGGAPLIIKLVEGTQGVGVVLAETDKAAESVINGFKSVKANILVQEFISEAKGRDIRCFVVGDKVVAAMERRAAKGEFRANIHLGGKAFEVKLTEKEKRIALAAAKTMNLKVAGVDLIRAKGGPKVLEVNSSPGLEGIEGVTGIDIAGLMIEHIEMQVSRRKKNKKPNGE
ncbi:MAG: 30S ribosomal protein S6--L-glutamate ligase [Alphaproteobacteria bacterium]|nr:30S ribosomal protein S6--L-glutamate ligase [Alphaproteobacteria bacterium]